MSCSPFLSKDHWPAAYMPETVFQHFLSTKYHTQKREYLHFYGREEFLNTLKSNEKFYNFWIRIQEQRPEKKEYFLSLATNLDEVFDPCWIECAYEKYQQQNAFEALSEQEIRTLQNEFDEFRPAAYRAALEGESPVLPWEPDHENGSMLATLPEELFGRVLPLLETLDTFRMTLVCKRWKMIVSANAMKLKKAEYEATTHLITFTDWTDPKKTPQSRTFLHQYQMFSWCLTRWYCGISKQLEILILDHPVPYTKLSNLLQSCPNLRQLRIGYDGDRHVVPPGMILSRVKLRKLEVFLSSCAPYWLGRINAFRQLHRDVLVSSPSLRVFRGPLNVEDFLAIGTRTSVSNVFNKLVALELQNFAASVLEALARIDNLQLKYLRLGSYVYNSKVNEIHDEAQSRNALHQLLPKLGRLEVLITSTNIGITNETIQLLVDLELSLSVAVLHHAYVYAENEVFEWDPSIEIDPLQPDVLTSFQNMLLMKNPGIDLSEIQFLLVKGETLDKLEATNSGFTFLSLLDDYFEASLDFNLCNPHMQRRLGIDF